MRRKISLMFIFSFLISNAMFAAFEVEPQTRPKVSVKGVFAKDFVIFSGVKDLPAAGYGIAMGVGAAFEYPIVPIFALGLQGNASWELESKGPSYYDIDGLFKFQFDLVENAVASNIYLSFPVGLSLMPWQLTKDLNIGFNASGFVGSHFHFAERYGFFVEAGYLYRYMPVVFTPSNVPVTLHFHEIAANIGFSFGF